MRIVDLFAGCGGMSLGFEKAGHEILAAYDNWQVAIDIYKENFLHPIYKKDLSQEDITSEIQSLAPDMIIGGPPCQDFSIAGKLDLTGKRANLTRTFCNIVTTVKPRWFVMENVSTIERSPIFNEVLTKFENAGYGITKMVIDASRVGVPQMRKRYFVIGHMGDVNDFLKKALTAGFSVNRMTIREYFKDMPLQTDFIYQHPRNYNRRGVFSIDEPCSTIRSVNRPIPSNYVPHSADKTTDLSKVRPLTTKERSLVQSFPPTFVFVGSPSAIEQAIGNAVPVKLAEYVGKTILGYEHEIMSPKRL